MGGLRAPSHCLFRGHRRVWASWREGRRPRASGVHGRPEPAPRGTPPWSPSPGRTIASGPLLVKGHVSCKYIYIIKVNAGGRSKTLNNLTRKKKKENKSGWIMFAPPPKYTPRREKHLSHKRTGLPALGGNRCGRKMVRCTISRNFMRIPFWGGRWFWSTSIWGDTIRTPAPPLPQKDCLQKNILFE